MSVALLGSVQTFTSGAASTSTTFTISSGTAVTVVGVSGYKSANYFSGGSITLNGVAGSLATSYDSDSNYGMVALFYWVSPASGTQTISYTWNSGTTVTGMSMFLACYSGVDTTSPISSTSSVAAHATSSTTASLTMPTGGLGVAVCYANSASGPSTVTWTGATSQADSNYNSDHAAYAHSTSSGTIKISFSGSGPDSAVSAAILNPASAAAPTNLFFF